MLTTDLRNGLAPADLAMASVIQLRFMAMGGYIPSNSSEIHKKAIASINGGGLLIVGTKNERPAHT